MNGYEYILTKQIQWAWNHNIELIGSEGERGRPAYVRTLEDNLYEPLQPDVYESFSSGDGNEIQGTEECPAKMQAVHSSSALAVNIFQYWQKIGQSSRLAAVCGFCEKGHSISQRIAFEDKYSIDDKFLIPPNIDVVFHNSDSFRYKCFAIECKFSEPYGSQGHGGLKPAYLDISNMWADIPSLHELAKTISPDDKRYEHFHPAQLIKHILGLKKKMLRKDGFRLLYLWYDVFGPEGVTHRKEIDDFMEFTKADSIKFHALSYQELIARLFYEFRSDHPDYIKYITDRYL